MNINMPAKGGSASGGKLIVGLGNPGKKYDNTWHNLGFDASAELRAILDLAPFKKSARFQADVSESKLGGEKIILARPLTFMNNSGDSVKSIASFFKIKPQDIIVIHDDIDLPLGKIRLANNSSAGGHNGVKSIIEQLGAKNFIRIKIGVKTDKLEKIAPADYVLMKLDKDDKPAVKKQIKNAAEAAKAILESGLEKAMNQWN